MNGVNSRKRMVMESVEKNPGGLSLSLSLSLAPTFLSSTKWNILDIHGHIIYLPFSIYHFFNRGKETTSK